MKKILLFISFLSIIFAEGFPTESFSQISKQKINQPSLTSEMKQKTYKSLIDSLKNTPSGEYQFLLGTLYLNGAPMPDSNGDTIKKDTEKALHYFNKAISLGYYNAAQILGSLYLYHQDLNTKPHHIEKAIKLLELATKHGLYDSTVVLSDIYFNYKEDKNKGLEYLKLGAEHHIPAAQLMLAILYNWGSSDGKGFNVPKDPYTAQMLLTKACTSKNANESVKKFCNSNSVVKKERK